MTINRHEIHRPDSINWQAVSQRHLPISSLARLLLLNGNRVSDQYRRKKHRLVVYLTPLQFHRPVPGREHGILYSGFPTIPFTLRPLRYSTCLTFQVSRPPFFSPNIAIPPHLRHMIAHRPTRSAHTRLVLELGPDTARCFGLDIASFSLDVTRWVQIDLFRLFKLRRCGDVRLALRDLWTGDFGSVGSWMGRGW